MIDALVENPEIVSVKYDCTTQDELSRTRYYNISISLPRQEKTEIKPTDNPNDKHHEERPISFNPDTDSIG